MTNEIIKEVALSQNPNFKLGEYLYMGMAIIKNKRVCISVAYKIDYCIKKALEFTSIDKNITFTHINKVRTGELERCEKFLIPKE